ncbi:ABC transporter substrate-binding protein [Tengunoibacter tsumagoiensis]|uniref:ABC transporter substrate-binding protein n=1 Tax=Tengunoibacter tsumagoiensis TaxID=2014871 RepID=A0A402AAB6_9CHLR|nr:ABC transporter substrate-binding protein [Tengunoibacter tsumagoiensis]GCE15895.1 ABC transporter substrate-binding protein [Tengunoibacter tsumagoiensis]
MKLPSKTLTLWLVVFCALLPLLSSCGDSASSSSSDTLSILHITAKATPNGAVFQQILHDFETQNHVTVKQTIAASDATQVYETSLVAGKEADVVMVNLADKATEWSKEGAVIDVKDLAQQWGISSQLIPEATKEWTQDGKLVAFPYNGFKWPVWYNMDLLKSVGITQAPTTTDELIADGKALQAAGKGGFVVGGNDWSGYTLFTQFMEAYMKADEIGNVLKNGTFCSNPNVMKGINLFNQIRDSGVFVKDVAGLTADQMNSQFYTAGASMMSAGSWAFAGASSDLANHIYLGGLPIPSGSAYDKPTAYQGYTSMGIWISPNGQKHLDVVRKFVQYMFSSSVIAKQVSTGMIPTLKSVQPDPNASPLLKQATTELDNRVSYISTNDVSVPGNVQQNLIRATGLAYTKGQSSPQICQSLEGAYKQ